MLIVMLAIVALAGLIMAFAAFPHRGQDMPVVPWLGGAMRSAADAMPTLDSEPAEQPGAPR